MNFFRRKLKNGITVLFERRDLPIVSVSITNKFGGAYEDEKIKGVAHVIEHVTFTGTKTRSSEEISKEIEKRGGILNAFTTHEVTSFWFKLPSEHLFAGLEILSDMLTNPTFEKEKFEKEKRVILEEIKMYHDNPRAAVYDQIERNLYLPPFGELIIGSKDSVSSLDRDFVFSLFEKSYSPEDYIVSIVGNADLDSVCDFLEKKFKKRETKKEILPPKKHNKETTEERENIDQAHFVFAIHAPMPDSSDFQALEVLDAYLASGMSSRLFIEIREKRGLAYTVSSSLESEKNYAYYTIYAGTKKEAIEEVKSIILKEFEDIKNMSQKDLDEAKTRLIGLKKVMSEESINVMNNLMSHELSGKAEDYYEYEERINSVSLEQVKKVAKISKYSTAAIVPK